MRVTVLLLLAAAALMATPAQAQTPPLCERINTSLDNLAKDDAAIFAEGLGDNSAPRETTRQLRELNNGIQRNTLVQVAIANRCSLARIPPGAGAFMLPAMECATQRLRQPTSTEIPQCDRSTWAPAN